MAKRTSSSSTVLLWVASLISVAALSWGVYRVLGKSGDWVMIAAGSVGLVLVLTAKAIADQIRRGQPTQPDQLLQPLTERLDQIAILLNLMSEQQLLSDRAIAIAYREKDREALNRAVHEEMARKDWESALSLVEEMEKAFGIRGEAVRLRAEINTQRLETSRKQIADVVQTIDKHTRGEQWNAAIREADKLLQLFPENEQVRNLPHEIDNRRQAYKKQLLQSWHEAVARHDNDGSIEILKQLDPYLTPAEAETMQETVRGVFKERLYNLGAQFAVAVKENRLPDALRVGEAISTEFPNSRMAQEVKDSIEAMKRRTAEPGASAAGVAVGTAR